MEGDGCAHRYPASLGSRHGRPISCRQSLIDTGTSDPAPRQAAREHAVRGTHHTAKALSSWFGTGAGHRSLVVGCRSSIFGGRSSVVGGRSSVA